MKDFKRILYVYDRETEKGTAFERSVDLANHNRAVLTVVEVLQEISRLVPLASGPKEMREFKKIALEDSTERLENLIASIKDKQIEVATKILWGTDWLEIIREVIRSHHDLVMLSPRKKGKFQEMLFGSRIMHLMRKCPSPVWAIKPTKHKKFNRILVAVDPAPFDTEQDALNGKIMKLAVSLAQSEKSELHIVHCWTPFLENVLRSRSGLPSREVDRLVRENRKTHEKWFNNLLEKYTLDDVSHKIHLLKGEPDKSIVDLAKKRRVELIVMGTVSRTGLAGFLIGNTAEKVLHNIDCSVLAVKPDGFVTPVELE